MKSQAKQGIAIFDVDGTLLRGSCLLLAAHKSKRLWGKIIATLASFPWLMAWQMANQYRAFQAGGYCRFWHLRSGQHCRGLRESRLVARPIEGQSQS